MFHELVDLSVGSLELVLIATWRALPLLMIALLAELIFRRRMAPKYHVVLWSLVVVRLMLPVSFASPVSLHGPIDRVIANSPQSAERSIDPHRASEDLYELQHLSVTVGQQEVPRLDPPVFAEPSQSTSIHVMDLLCVLLLSMWAVTSCSLLLRGLVAHLRFAFRLRRCQELDHPDLESLLLVECHALRVGRRPQLKEVPGLETPAVFGLFRATICLPSSTLENLSRCELRWVIRHELSHVRRRDTWLLTFVSVVKAMQWFNPVAMFAVSRVLLYVEAAADDLAMFGSTSSEKNAYGHLLLRFAESTQRRTVTSAIGLLHFVTKRRLRTRIERLTHDVHLQGRFVPRAIAITTIAAALFGLTDASKPKLETSEVPIHLPATKNAIVDRDAVDTADATLRVYDVGDVMTAIENYQPEHDAEVLLRTAIKGMAPIEEIRLEEDQLQLEATDEQAQALSMMFAAWQASGPQKLIVEMRVIQADLSLASSANWFNEGIDDFVHVGSQPVASAIISDADFREFMIEMQRSAQGRILFAPKVTLFNGQHATIADIAKRRFVTDVEQQADGKLRPVAKELETGLRVVFQTVVTERGQVNLDLELQTSKIDSVELANLPIQDGTDANHVTVEVPRMSSNHVRTSAPLSNAETLVIAVSQPFRRGEANSSSTALLYAFTPRLLSE